MHDADPDPAADQRVHADGGDGDTGWVFPEGAAFAGAVGEVPVVRMPAP
ncbi:hypothetical protein M2169_005819 [Streptomyces sp. MJP52]|nr:hypothetical protein [Streptomyces sp. MJP52]